MAQPLNPLPIALPMASPIAEVLPRMAAEIQALIPGAEVRLFGSQAKGTARHDSDIDLLITIPDQWLAAHDRFLTLGELWNRLGRDDISLDLLLYSQSEVRERQELSSSVVAKAYREGVLLHAQP